MKIECTLRNASTEINGVRFALSDAGTMVSVDDVPQEAAERFLRIEGYREFGGRSRKTETPAAETKQPEAKPEGEAPDAKPEGQSEGEAPARGRRAKAA